MFHKFRSLDLHWLSLSAITVLINVPFFTSRLVLLHDTLNSFIFFQFAYSELLLRNEFPRWIPLMGYGIPFDFNLFSCLLPTDYVMMAIGWLLGVKDAPLLFKLSILLSQAVFALGLYLLTSRLLTSRLAVWMVCLGGLLTNSWLFNSAWNFSPIYLMPLELFLLIDFLSSENPSKLWAAAIVEIVSLLGTVSYIAPLHLLVLGTFLLTLIAQKPKLIRLFLRWRNFLHPLFALFLGLAFLLGSLIFGMEVVFLTADRDPATGNVPLDVFLNLYRYPLAAVLATMFKGDLPIGELIVYAGLMPIIGWGYGLARRGDAFFVSFSAVALVLFWFSFGGWFATAAYYAVPMMNKFRHIGFALGTFKLFLLILGGFGFDRMLQDMRSPGPLGESERSNEGGSNWGRWGVIALAVVGVVDFLVHRRAGDFTDFTLKTCDQSFAQEWFAPYVLQLKLFVYAVLLIAIVVAVRRGAVNWTRYMGPIILAIYLADVGFFYSLIVTHAPFNPPGLAMGREFDVGDLTYSAERLWTIPRPPYPPDIPKRVGNITRVITSPRHGFFNSFASVYASLYLLMRVDVLAPQWRLDQMMPGVKKMIEARGGLVPGDAPAILLPEKDDPAFVRSLGYQIPKTRIVHDAVFAADEDEALRRFSRQEDPSPAETIVLIGKEPASSKDGPPLPEPDSVDVVHFSANRMVIRTHAKTAGWLFNADAFHPAWSATVNDSPADVLPANIGCKAVHVPQGPAEIVFSFDGGARTWVRRGVALWGSLAGFILTGSLGLALFGRTGQLTARFRS